jgi:uncharacterized protein YbjT (DUF2867 family)
MERLVSVQSTGHMKLVVFGATGGTGRHLVDLALDANHDVTAFARTAPPVVHPRLRVVLGDVRDTEVTSAACAGQDAALIAIGAPARDRSRVRTTGTRAIVAGLKRAGVRRVVCLSTIGIGDSSAQLTPLYRWVLVPLLLRHAFADHLGQEQVLRDSGLDWTVVRAGPLTDRPATRALRHGFGPQDRAPGHTPRAEVAAFMLSQVTDDQYLHRTPAVAA